MLLYSGMVSLKASKNEMVCMKAPKKSKQVPRFLKILFFPEQEKGEGGGVSISSIRPLVRVRMQLTMRRAKTPKAILGKIFFP